MAKGKRSTKSRAEGAVTDAGHHSLVWLQGLLCGALVALATPTALLLGVLLGPALVAMLLDHEAGKPVGRSVGLCSMAAAISPLKTLWVTGHNMSEAAALLSDPQVIGMVWSAAAGGWLLAQLAPILVRAALEAHAIARAARLKAERARLAEEWTLEVNRDDQSVST